MKLNCNILAMNTRKVKFINSIYTSMAASLLDILIIHVFWYHNLVQSPLTFYECWSVWSIGHGRSNSMSLLKLSYERLLFVHLR